jgi:signal transduction histidine kinase
MSNHDNLEMNLQEIVVVDDSLTNLQFLTNLFEGYGYCVRPASNGLLALETVAARLPDLILLDVKMPGMDGYEVCRRIKSDEHSRKVPVIFISALGETTDKVEGFKAGGVDYITKPFEREEVLARVGTHLRLGELTEHLERKVAERTEALHSANAQLHRELSERKAAEEALHRLNAELDRRVLERTAELEASNMELEGFTYTVSHDLRAPLRHIHGFLELLQKKMSAALDEQCRHYMHNISDAAQKMGRLIDELLSFSRMGRHVLSFRKVDLGELVRDILRELEPETAGRNIDWRIGDLPVVSGDGAMLRTVLVSLISNALKFTHLREEARIEIGSLPGQEAEAVIYVRDNGVGFDMAYADKLFGVFQRLHREEEFEGTGIGLANARRIIARHGGRTWAEGRPDQGATFYVALPQQ